MRVRPLTQNFEFYKRIDIPITRIESSEVAAAKGLQAKGNERQVPPWFDATANHLRFRPLQGDTNADVVVVGGGVAGVTIARAIAEQGLKPVVLTAGTLAGETTSNMGALHTRIPDEAYTELVTRYGPEQAASYIRELSAAHGWMRDVAEHVGADYKPGDFHVVSFEPVKDSGLPEEFEVVHASDPNTSLITDPQEAAKLLPGASPAPKSALSLHGAGLLDPRKLVLGMASELPEVHENSAVTRISIGAPGQPVDVYTEHGVVHANKVVFATGSPTSPFGYLSKLCQPTQCFATAVRVPNEQVPPGGWCNTRYPDYDYGRPLYPNSDGKTSTVLVGGGARWLNEQSHLTESSKLDGRIQELFPGGEVQRRWTGTIYMAPDGLPIWEQHPDYPQISGAYALGGSGLDFSSLLARNYVRAGLQDGENILASSRLSEAHTGTNRMLQHERPRVIKHPARRTSDGASRRL